MTPYMIYWRVCYTTEDLPCVSHSPDHYCTETPQTTSNILQTIACSGLHVKSKGIIKKKKKKGEEEEDDEDEKEDN